jgi:histidyl-tRNA synthetase
MMIEPRLGAGLRDYLPAEAIARQQMIDTIRSVFELFGFVPLDTPGLELEEILTGGDPNFKMQIFRVRLRSEEENLSLRFDLTVPLARVIAQYPNEITRPFKRYQVGKVWRGEKPQAGRFREFVQFDADIVGCAKMSADAEIISLMYETMTRLGISEFIIRVNNRKVLNGLPEYVGFDKEQTVEVLRLIDKLDRFGWENVAGEMKEKLGFSKKQLSLLKNFLDFQSGNQTETVKGIKKLMDKSPTAMEGAKELGEIIEHVRALGVPDEKWTIDLSVARGLGYYTGPVFETVLTNLPTIGSVFSGGRYDDLIARFSTASIPATGASVGVDRLFAALQKLGLVQTKRTISQVLVLNFDKESELVCETIVGQLRRAAIPTDLYLGKEETLKGQLAFAVREGYPVVVLIGSTERERKSAMVRDMRSRTQTEVAQTEILTKVKEILNL